MERTKTNEGSKMKKNFKREDNSATAPGGPDAGAVLAAMQQQLASIERKLDGLVSQSSEKPFKGDHYVKPFQRFDHFRRHENRDQGNSFHDRKFTRAICAECHQECEVPFKPSGDRPVYCKDCFSRRKQAGPFKAEYDRGPRREGDFKRKDYSDKKQASKSLRHGGKKPVSRRRKKK